MDFVLNLGLTLMTGELIPLGVVMMQTVLIFKSREIVVDGTKIRCNNRNGANGKVEFSPANTVSFEYFLVNSLF